MDADGHGQGDPATFLVPWVHFAVKVAAQVIGSDVNARAWLLFAASVRRIEEFPSMREWHHALTCARMSSDLQPDRSKPSFAEAAVSASEAGKHVAAILAGASHPAGAAAVVAHVACAVSRAIECDPTIDLVAAWRGCFETTCAEGTP